ncbi:hypothetical protein GCM10027261_30480 [Geodermatophilus arenarius]|uniref:Arabinosyltransferase domain-containing protein n=1 Tax=Geodermatophilus arenarius TaxID=1137990 RepID=A0ABV9LME7_9ACTN
MDVVGEARPRPVADPGPPPPPRSRGLSRLGVLAALVAVLGAVLLPLAPVRMSTPAVTWPQDPARPESTMLELTNQEPLALDLRVGCAAVRAAADVPGGVVFSTIVPEHPAAGTDGLLVTSSDGRVRVVDRGTEVLDQSVPAGDCTYRVTADADGLTVERDGTRVAGLAPPDGGTVLPDVDVLATGLTALPDGDLRVSLTVDDQFDTTPTPAKLALTGLVLVAALVALLALAAADRRRGPPSGPRAPEPRAARPRGAARWAGGAVDVAVVATALLWLFIAPTSDDDGYYAAMARNAQEAGFVGNYYQLLNQSFTPFTWFYRLLGWWQELGDSPTLLRLPSLVTGLVTWVLLRRLVARAGALPPAVAASAWGPVAARLLLAAAFLAWWLPYGIGVRPEAVVGVLALATLVAVAAALRTGRLLPVGLAFGAAGLAVACHPTGFVALAPLVATLPRLARLVAAGRGRAEAAGRTLLVLAPGAFAVCAAFADGTLNDFRRGQEIFLSIQRQDAWYDEWQRYAFLFQSIPMGSYARRTAVLAGIVALLWFLVLAVAARARDVRVPPTLLLAGGSLGAALLLLWFTPSKWTHHFGALSGLGPLFLALFLVAVPGLVRAVTRDRPVSPAVPALALGSGVVVAALAMRGPNSWPYTWLPGMPNPDEPPSVGPVALDDLLTWAVVALVVLAAVRGLGRRAGAGWAVAVPVLALVLLLTSVGYLVGSFTLAGLRTLDTWSPGAAALTDPLARSCGAAGDVDVLDVAAARPLAPVPGGPASEGPADFAAGSGWFAAGPPPGEGVATWSWGSLTGPGGEDTTGGQVTPWFPLPEPAGDEEAAVLAAGRLVGANGLRVEYAEPAGDGGAPRVLRTQDLADGLDSPRWRTFVLDARGARDAGAGLVRLVADDRSVGRGGWLAFTGPSVLPQVPLTELLPADAPVAVAWQISFLFPCQRQPVVRSGVTEPAAYGIVWRPDGSTDGLVDNTWQVFRGGVFAPVERTSAVTELGVRLRGTPGVRQVQVLRFDVPYARDAYDLERSRVTRPGWAGPAPD